MTVQLKKGDIAPEFSLPDKDNKEVSLKDYRGKWVILYFYPKDNTPGCTIEAREFTKQSKDLSELSAVVIGVSADTPESHAKFTKKHDLITSMMNILLKT